MDSIETNEKADKIIDALVCGFRPAIGFAIGGAAPGLFLSQLFYLWKRFADKDGWVYASTRSIMSVTCLTRGQQAKAVQVLASRGIIEIKHGLANQMMYKVNRDTLSRLVLEASGCDKTGKLYDKGYGLCQEDLHEMNCFCKDPYSETVLAYMRGQRNHRINAFGADYTTVEMIDARRKYYGNQCYLCGKPAEAMDHVKPLAKGGAHLPCNLRPICKRCNSIKGKRWPYLIEGFAKSVRFVSV